MKYRGHMLFLFCSYMHVMVAREEKKSPEAMKQFFNENLEQSWHARCQACHKFVTYQKSDILAQQQPHSEEKATVDRGAQLFKQGHSLSS